MSQSHFSNPVFYTENYLNDESINKLNLGTKVEYKILEGLVATGTGNYFTGQNFREAFIKSNPFNSCQRTLVINSALLSAIG